MTRQGLWFYSIEWQGPGISHALNTMVTLQNAHKTKQPTWKQGAHTVRANITFMDLSFVLSLVDYLGYLVHSSMSSLFLPPVHQWKLTLSWMWLEWGAIRLYLWGIIQQKRGFCWVYSLSLYWYVKPSGVISIRGVGKYKWKVDIKWKRNISQSRQISELSSHPGDLAIIIDRVHTVGHLGHLEWWS